MKSVKVRTEKISLALRMANHVGVLLMVVAALGFSTANASSITEFFDAAYECQNVHPFACATEPATIYNTGDFFGEDFTGTGLASVFQLSLNTLIDNALLVGQTEAFNVSINGTVVGNVSVPGVAVLAGSPPVPTQTSQTLTQVFDFTPISGPNYDVRFTVTSPTIGPGLGTIGFNHDGTSSSVTFNTPEPGTILLLGVGLLGLVIRRTRKA
jgi:hypothetical protein